MENLQKKSIFTAEQEDAINASGSFVIVSAAAGSGKTTVLIEKLIRLLSDPENGVRADKLIIVTFTNDAASQIIRKLGTALNKAVFECGADAENAEKKKHLLRQQTYLGSAKISTISSFCFNILRGSSDELGISSDFRILDDTEGELLLLRAVEETADQYFSGNDEQKKQIEEIYSYFGWYSRVARDKHEKYKNFIKFRDFLLSVPFCRERFIAPTAEEYKKGYSGDFDPFKTRYGKMYSDIALGILGRKDVREAAEYLYAAWSTILSGSKKIFTAKPNSRAAAMYYSSADTLRALHSWYSAPDGNISGCEGWDRLFAAMSFSGDIFRSELTTREKNVAAVFEEADIAEYDAREFCREADLLADAFSAAAGIHPCTAAELKDDYCDHFKRLESICGFIDSVNERFDSLKRNVNALVFADGELLALRLLGKLTDDGKIIKTPIAEKLSAEYSFVMIDEFQDSNDIQDMIFRLLSPCGDSENEGKNMFVVGDIKQSIYNFRLANPWLFRYYLENSGSYSRGCADDLPKHILLNRNFRSSKSVIDLVNYLFERLMTKDFGGVNYDDSQKLIYSGESWENNSENSALTARLGSLETEILLTDEKNAPFVLSDPSVGTEGEDNGDQSSDDSSAEDSDIKAAQLEAANVALKIYRLINDNGISARDICILCPANNDAPFFKEELEKYGIRASLDNHSKYLESREISAVINILRILDDPHRNVAMAGCLMTPLFMFSADDMAVLTVFRGKRSIYEGILALEKMSEEDIPQLSAELDILPQSISSAAEKARYFLGIFRRLRRYSAVMGIEDLIRRIYDVTEMIPLMSMYPDGASKRANLMLLPGYAAAYEGSVSCGSGGIYGFIRYIDSMIPNKMDMKSSSGASEAEDAVAIKTIHKSKGLEYPVVFLCRCHKAMHGEKDDLIYNLSGGIGFSRRNTAVNTSYLSLPAELIAHEKLDELTGEHLRLLYVALTRAKHKLFISAVMKLSGKEGGVYREGAVPAGGNYGSFECDITECDPDEFLTDYYNEVVSPSVSGDSLIPERLMRMKKNGAMINWIIAALSLSGMNCFNFEHRPRDSRAPNVSVKLLHYDERTADLLKSENSSENSSSTGFLSAVPDRKLMEELSALRAYDTDERFDADRARRDIPAKLTVTEITSAAVDAEKNESMPDRNFVGYEKELSPLIPSARTLSSAERGTAVHAFLQSADLKSLPAANDEECISNIGEEAARLCLEGILSDAQSDYLANSRKFKRRMCAFFKSSLWKEEFLPASDGDILREQPFMAKISDIVNKNDKDSLDEKLKTYYNKYYNDTFVQGIADCIIRKDNGFVLIDYKTNEGKSHQQLREQYSVQLLLYRRVFERIYGLPKGSGKAYIYTFGLDAEQPDSNIILIGD